MYHIMGEVGERWMARLLDGEKPRKSCPRPVRTKKVEACVKHENLIPSGSVEGNIKCLRELFNIRQNLNLELKPRMTTFHEKHIKEGKTNCRKLYKRHLAGEKFKHMVTSDDVDVYLSDSGKNRAIAYWKRDVGTSKEGTLGAKEQLPTGFMVVRAVCHRGKFILYRINPKVKVNAKDYEQNVLKPLLREEIPCMYDGEVSMVEQQ